MLNVIIPIAVMIAIIVIKPIPLIGGKVHFALLAAGAVALLVGGIYNPMDWILAYIDR